MEDEEELFEDNDWGDIIEIENLFWLESNSFRIEEDVDNEFDDIEGNNFDKV